MIELMDRTIECEVSFEWFDDDTVTSDTDREHVAEMLADGYIEGELCGDDDARGWWKII